MTVTGLENNNYCAHSPIPVQLVSDTGEGNVVFYIQLLIGGVGMLDIPGKLYSFGNTARLDLSPWIKLAMERFEEIRTYTTNLQTVADTYKKNIMVQFTGEDSLGDIEQIDINRTFLHCALKEGRIIEDGITNVRVWKGFPISWVEGSNRLLVVPNGSTAPAIPKQIEYIQDNCQGTYVKWLNEYGYYSYWLFPYSRLYQTSGDEYYRTPRSIFDTNKTSNEDTVGFEATEKITLKDLIPKKYYPQFRSLVFSPEVYMLDPQYNFNTVIQPGKWIKIIQSDPEFEREVLSRNSAEFEIEFDLPKPYTQTRL